MHRADTCFKLLVFSVHVAFLKTCVMCGSKHSPQSHTHHPRSLHQRPRVPAHPQLVTALNTKSRVLWWHSFQRPRPVCSRRAPLVKATHCTNLYASLLQSTLPNWHVPVLAHVSLRQKVPGFHERRRIPLR